MCRIALLFLVSAGVFAASEAKHVRAGSVQLGEYPAMVVRLRKKALDSLFRTGAELAAKHAEKVPLPDVSGSTGGVEIKTSNMKLKEFLPPVIEYQLQAPNKIVQGSINFPLNVFEGDFKAIRSTLVSTQTDNGRISFLAKQVNVTFDAEITEFENGQPQIGAFNCQAFLGPCSLTVKDASHKFSTDVLGLAAKAIRPIYNSQVCPTAKRIIKSQLNRLLAKIPNVIEFNKELAIKYQIRPRVTRDAVQVGLHGRILTETVSPYTPRNFVEAPSQNATVVLLLSDAPINDLLDQGYVNKKLEKTINKESHDLLYSLISLKCKKNRDTNNKDMSLGCAVPSLPVKYGQDATTELKIKATRAPKVDFTLDKASFTAGVSTELSVTNATGTHHDFGAKIDFKGSVQVRIDNGSIFGKIKIEEMTVDIDDPESKKYEAEIKEVTTDILERVVNKGFLLKGLPLNLPFGFGVTDPLVKFNMGTLQAHTGFEYNPQKYDHQGNNGHHGGHGGNGGEDNGQHGGHGGHNSGQDD